ALRDRPPFPTRRSSDLDGAQGPRLGDRGAGPLLPGGRWPAGPEGVALEDTPTPLRGEPLRPLRQAQGPRLRTSPLQGAVRGAEPVPIASRKSKRVLLLP